VAARGYETQQDFQQMQELLMAARARVDDWRYPHVGELAWDFFMVACHLQPHEHIRLWHEQEGRLVGYALLGDDSSFDCQAMPEYTWSGIEFDALAWAETRLRVLRRRDAGRWGGPCVTRTRQDDARRIAFLEQHGFRRGEYAEVNLVRSLDEPIPDATLPTGFQVRAVAAAGDSAARAGAQREVWQPWSVGQVSDDDYAHLMELPGYERDLDVVTVTPDGVIAAYLNGWIDPVNRIGEFGPVGARVAYRRRGLTRAALLEGLRRMRGRGMDRVCVSTGESNTAAIRLYESIGFAVANKSLDFLKVA
jgi:ribosomal protein S18 acetylase RimI-like enzyme